MISFLRKTFWYSLLFVIVVMYSGMYDLRAA